MGTLCKLDSERAAREVRGQIEAARNVRAVVVTGERVFYDKACGSPVALGM